MLKIIVPGNEFFDEEKQEFINEEPVVLELEHSLVSLSKWESKWEKPFLGTDVKTTEEVFGYIESMITTPEFPPGVLSRFTQENLEEINDYIGAKMTATWFSDIQKTTQQKETITAELIYYWMVAFQIPFECQNWHLSRLFTLIRVCSVKNDTSDKPKKLTSADLADRRRLNEMRKAQLGTSG